MLRILFNLLSFLLLLSISSCSSGLSINDFFGIKMDTDDYHDFQIQRYSEIDGISYTNNVLMDSKIFSWAELEGNKLKIKIVNDSYQSITLSFINDRYEIQDVDGITYVLIKPPPINYTSLSELKPGDSFEVLLDIPMNFWETIGQKDPQFSTKDFFAQFWKGQNHLHVTKERINFVKIVLNKRTTIILKPVPVND